MDKYEYNLIIDQIKQAVRNRDIEAAVKIAEKIDWKKEKEVSVLLIAADAYELGRQYAKAKELLLIAYEKAQAGKNLAYRLALLSAKTKEFDEAGEFYQDFVEMAPRDTARYVLQYRIAKSKGEPVEKLIRILEEYVDLDMEEKWMYELAKLYHIAGDVEKCVDLCDEMSLWFSHGEYVRRALDLKKRYKPLTKRQEENYNKADADFAAADAESKVDEADKKGTKEAESDNDEKENIKNQATIPFTILKQEDLKKSVTDAKENKQNEKPLQDTMPIPGEIDIEDIHVKPLDGSGVDTMDLQAELAKNMQQIMQDEESMKKIQEENVAKPDKITMTLDPLYKYEAGGQIGLDVEEPTPVEKQITGQLSIEEVLRNLEERGILKADTVNKTVETLEQAAETVEQAAEEAALEAEIKKENETIVEDIEIKDLAEDGEMTEMESALESFADDAANGFVFTDEIDSQAIEKALNDAQTKPIPDMAAVDSISKEKERIGDITAEYEVVAEGKAADYEEYMSDEEQGSEEATEQNIEESDATLVEYNIAETEGDVKVSEGESDIPVKEKLESDDMLKESDLDEEITLEKVESGIGVFGDGAAVELSNDVPVLDLSFDTPVKKIHPGIAPASEPVPANTASLRELFADLDEATKREIGILDEEPQEEDNQTTDNEIEQGKTLEADAATEELADAVAQNLTDATSDDLKDSVAEDADKNDEAVDNTLNDVKELSESENVSENTDAETEDETDANSESEEKAEEIVEESAEEITEASAEEREVTEVGETTQQNEAQKQDEESKEQSVYSNKQNDVPQVKVTTNTNLTQTMSLNLEKIIVTDEEMLPFESFKPVNGLEQKIKDTVIALATSYTASGHSKEGNVMILGDDKSGKTTMAIELIKLINKKRERATRRIAKVDSSVLNTRGIRSSMKKLVGSDLIVENAQHLRKSVLNEFLDISKYYTGDMLIVFEGETSALKTMRNESEEIAAMFDHVLIIKEYDVKEWVAYAKKYVATKNYMIDEMGTLALYKAIDDFYGRHQGIDQNDVENIVNRAIKKASKKVTRKITNLFSAKNDDTGMDILKEADFK